MAHMMGISHQTLMEEITHEEFSGWINFFERQPVGWREDLRTYYVMSSMAGSKKKPEEIFPSLQQIKDAEADTPYDEAQLKEQRKMNQSLKASALGALFMSKIK